MPCGADFCGGGGGGDSAIHEIFRRITKCYHAAQTQAMAASDHTPAVLPAISQDARWALVERVLASPSLQTSPRQQELFRYLAECALQDPPALVSEPQVGVAVFHRAPDYDTSVDTIVRVQVSQLRKKLEHYFLSEGREEPVLIELPRGSYLPVFRSRVRAEEPVAPNEAPASTAAPPSPLAEHRLRLLAALLTVALAAIGVLALQNARLRERQAHAARPYLDHFWAQFFENRVPTQIAMSDGGVLALAEARERSVTLSEYRAASYPRGVVETMTADEKTQSALLRTASRAFTPPNDAMVAHETASMCARHQAVCRILSARDLRVNLQTPENMILIGHKRANPWLELFEGGMNFRYGFDDAKRWAAISNVSPLEGESASYKADWGRRGYGVVAYMPKPGGGGNVLLIFGADLQSVEAGGHLVSDERAMSALHGRLGIGLGDRVPYVEVLLQTKLQGNATGDYEVIAHRLVKG